MRAGFCCWEAAVNANATVATAEVVTTAVRNDRSPMHAIGAMLLHWPRGGHWPYPVGAGCAGRYWRRALGQRDLIRRECLDHVIVFGERHLRHVLRSYARYYNGVRTHLSRAKDSPLPRDVQAVGIILPLPVVQGLHHHYVRI